MEHSAGLVLQFPKLLQYLSLSLPLRKRDPDRQTVVLETLYSKTTDRTSVLRSLQMSVCVEHSSETEHTVIADTDVKRQICD